MRIYPANIPSCSKYFSCRTSYQLGSRSTGGKIGVVFRMLYYQRTTGVLWWEPSLMTLSTTTLLHILPNRLSLRLLSDFSEGLSSLCSCTAIKITWEEPSLSPIINRCQVGGDQRESHVCSGTSAHFPGSSTWPCHCACLGGV